MDKTTARKLVEHLEHFDSLATAEMLLGKDYKTNDDVAGLGLALQVNAGELRKRLSKPWVM